MSRRVTFAAWPLTPALKKILITTCAVWLITTIAFQFFKFTILYDSLSLTPQKVYPGLAVWQPITYMWLHSVHNPSHIVFNMLFLWMFGGSLENTWGSRAFVKFYMICGVGSGIVVFIAGMLFYPDMPTVGASGAIYGLVVAWAINFPNRIVYILGIFPIKGKFFALIPIVWALLEFITLGSGVSHAAHLGGMAIGALLVTGYWRPRRIMNKMRYLWLKRRLKVLEGDGNKNLPPDKGYLH